MALSFSDGSDLSAACEPFDKADASPSSGASSVSSGADSDCDPQRPPRRSLWALLWLIPLTIWHVLHCYLTDPDPARGIPLEEFEDVPARRSDAKRHSDAMWRLQEEMETVHALVRSQQKDLEATRCMLREWQATTRDRELASLRSAEAEHRQLVEEVEEALRVTLTAAWHCRPQETLARWTPRKSCLSPRTPHPPPAAAEAAAAAVSLVVPPLALPLSPRSPCGTGSRLGPKSVSFSPCTEVCEFDSDADDSESSSPREARLAAAPRPSPTASGAQPLAPLKPPAPIINPLDLTMCLTTDTLALLERGQPIAAGRQPKRAGSPTPSDDELDCFAATLSPISTPRLGESPYASPARAVPVGGRGPGAGASAGAPPPARPLPPVVVLPPLGPLGAGGPLKRKRWRPQFSPL